MARLMLVFVLLLPAPVLAQSAAQNCAVAADMALVARAMVEEDIADERILGTLARIYNAPRPVMLAMIQEARKHTLPAPIFAAAMREACFAYFSRGRSP